jgi:hypothetical protein
VAAIVITVCVTGFIIWRTITKRSH